MWPFKKDKDQRLEDETHEEWMLRLFSQLDKNRKEFIVEAETVSNQFTCHNCRHIIAKPAAKTVIEQGTIWEVETGLIKYEREYCKLCVPKYDEITHESKKITSSSYTEYNTVYWRRIKCNKEGNLFLSDEDHKTIMPIEYLNA